MIVKCEQNDFNEIREIINDAASAYKGIIPADRWHEPYMTEDELKKQIDEGVQFWGYTEDGKIIGVMGIQFKGDVTLIRHAYVRTTDRNKGIGSRLLAHLNTISTTPVLIGTWEDAKWAIDFYQKHGFRLLPTEEKNYLLKKYWTIPARQIETSVVLAGPDWEKKAYIREAEHADISALTELINALGYETTEEKMKTRFKNIQNHNDFKTFVAIINKQVVGMAGLTKNYSYEQDGIYVRVLALVTKAEYRQNGIGKKLMETAENWAREIGAETVLLNCGNREERRIAQIFYQNIGYQIKSSGFKKKLK